MIVRVDRILVTGGAGFVGCSLVTKLMNESDHYIAVYDNLSTGSKENILSWFESPRFKFIFADMKDNSSLEKAVEASDAVVHLAANPVVALGSNDTKIDFYENLVTTYNLLEAMRKSRDCKKLIFASTSTVYGEANLLPTPENYGPLIPISLYGATKLACEGLISGYCHTFNMSGIGVRLANIIGPLSKHGVVFDLVNKLLANPAYLEVLGNGMQRKSYMHIDDCIDALLRVSEIQSDVKFDVYNMGTDDAITVIDIAKLLFQKLPIGPQKIKFNDMHQGRGWSGDVREFLLDSTKIKKLGWTAKYNSTQAVSFVADEYLKKCKLINS
jgi:UDP-glucose 4-epimerase